MVDANEILDLILLRQEGEYWDFKRQWYEDGHEGDLLHDIICMANNLVNRDAYIIIGVDEENDYAPYDISNDENKRNTQGIVDFLRSKKFAGDCRPTVTVEKVKIAGYHLDVLVIHNSMNTPFYLKQEFKGVHPNNIYARIQDTNTPKNESADIHYVEQLWKKRFGLHLSPLERMKILLQHKDEWDNVPGYESAKYYRYAPEYTIGYPCEDPENRDGYEYYLLNQTDNRPHWTMIRLKYHQTLLQEISGNFLDGGRHFSPTPQRDGFSVTEYSSWDVWYSYWVKGTLDYIVHEFYLDENNHEALWSDRRLLENVLIFENEDEHQTFNWYASEHWCEKDRYVDDIGKIYVPELSGYNTDIFREQITNVRILQKMLETYRAENTIE